MTDPINAVVSVSQVLDAAKSTPQSSPAMDQLATKFEAMMDKSGPHAGASPSAMPEAPSGPSAISQVLDKQEAYLTKTMNSVTQFSADAGHMNVGELVGRGMQISRDMALATTKLNVSMGVVQGSNKSLQGLLKNS